MEIIVLWMGEFAGTAVTNPHASCMLWVQVLVGNKCDMEESKRKVPYSQGQALADEFGIQFFETSAKNNIKVDEVGAHGVLAREASHTADCLHAIAPGMHLTPYGCVLHTVCLCRSGGLSLQHSDLLQGTGVSVPSLQA
jgi:hypothetical protein